MPRRTPPVHPRLQHQLELLGDRLRLARRRRKMTQKQLAERVYVSPPTIGKLETGDPTSSLATLVRVLSVLKLEHDIESLAADDTLGRELQDQELKRPTSTRRR